MSKERIYFIYKYTFPNGKVYIGQTYKESRRFGRVSSYKNMLVRKAMDKYPNFEKDIIEYCSKSNVDEREQFYIKLFNSMNKQFGYNLCSGGSFNKVLSDETKKRISEKHKGKKLSKEAIEKLSKAVIQIDQKTLDVINRFASVQEASRELGIDMSTISSVCRRKSSTAGGYYWCFEDDYDDSYVPRKIQWRGHVYSDEERLKLSKRYSGKNNPMHGTHRSKEENPHAIPVNQYSLKGKFIARFDCVKTAVEMLNISESYSNVCRCAKGRLKSAGGFIWRYDFADVPITEYKRKTTLGYKHTNEAKDKMSKARLGKIGGPRAKQVLQYSLDGFFVKEFISANNADNEMKLPSGKVSSVCAGKRKSAGGFMWRFKTDNYPLQITPYKNNNEKPVIQFNADGSIIKEWNNAAEASKQLGISASGITGCCKGYNKYKSAGGYHWKYKE